MGLRDPLNFFSPYERQPAGHENQLTRALLLVLRLSPITHAEWLRQIEPGRPNGEPLVLHRLPSATFDTQTRAARRVNEETEPVALVSVFLAPEQPQASDGAVVESDRLQVLDAAIDYGGELLVVVENKVYESGDLQARHVNVHGARVQIVDGQRTVVVLWRDLLEAFIGLRDRGLVAGAEAAVLDDFLTYVEDHFPDLGPFRTLKLCDGVPSRMARRLRQVLGETRNMEAETTPHGARVAVDAGQGAGRDAYLRVNDDDQIELVLYPADTLSQARAFYAQPTAVRGVRALAARGGWSAAANFHFGHMQRGLCWTSATIGLEDYLDLWQAEIQAGRANSVPRADWDSYWSWLIEHGIAQEDDRAAFDRDFTNTKRTSATPRPGLALLRHWSREEAETLDSRGSFVATVNEEVKRALATLAAR